MLGPEGVVAAIMGSLRAGMPGKLAEFRTRYEVLDGTLPDIERWLTTEPPDIAIDKPPMVVVVEQDSDSTDGVVKRSADGSGGSVFEFRYRIAVFAWAVGTTFEDTARTRQRYGLAVREVLLQTPGIGPDDPGELVIDPLTLVETYSGVSASASTREIIAGTSLNMEYKAQEYLGPRTPGSTAVTIPTVVTTAVDP